MLTRLALPALAAAAALLATAPFIGGAADARPGWQPPTEPSRPGDGNGVERLRRENAALRAELAETHRELDRGLDRLESIARTVRDRRTAARLHHALSDLRLNLGDGRGDPSDLDDDGWSQRPDEGGWSPRPDRPDTGPGWPQPQPQPAPQYAPMNPTEFQRLQAAVAASPFGSDQLNVISAAAARNRFSVDQLVALMTSLGFDDARVEIAVLIAPRIVDPQRWHLVYGALQFSGSRDALRQRVQL